jgi:hypothetical protein
MRRVLRVAVLGLIGVGCGPTSPPGEDETTGMATSTAGEGTTSGVTTGAPPTSTTGTSGAASTSSGPGTSMGPGGDTAGVTFIQELDGGPGGDPCDVIGQDCPEGEKCVPFADDGGNSWNNAKCVAVMADPAQVGEECFVVDSGVSGIDNCAFGAICWEVDPRTLLGECVAQCTGSPESPVCPEGSACAISGSGVIAVCLEDCDPLLQDCVRGEVCVVNPNNDGTVCIFEGSSSEGLHGACSFANSCDAGLVCLDPAAAMECDPEGPGCCEPFCDVTLANSCAGVGQACEPWWPPGEAPPGLEALGVCVVPA